MHGWSRAFALSLKKKHTNRCELVSLRVGNQRGWEGMRNEAERRRSRLKTEERWSKTKAWQKEIRGRQSHDADVMRLLRSIGGWSEKPADSAVGNNREWGHNRYKMNKSSSQREWQEVEKQGKLKKESRLIRCWKIWWWKISTSAPLNLRCKQINRGKNKFATHSELTCGLQSKSKRPESS